MNEDFEVQLVQCSQSFHLMIKFQVKRCPTQIDILRNISTAAQRVSRLKLFSVKKKTQLIDRRELSKIDL